MSTTPIEINPELDLVIERELDVPVERLWHAWTTADHLKQWFSPAPMTTPVAELDVRPGGVFRAVMRSPEGTEFDNTGCYLDVVTHERLVWTSALGANFRPVEAGVPYTAALLFEPTTTGTKYTAIAMHATKEIRDQHDAMGFLHGWNTVLDQLVALVKQDQA